MPIRMHQALARMIMLGLLISTLAVSASTPDADACSFPAPMVEVGPTFDLEPGDTLTVRGYGFLDVRQGIIPPDLPPDTPVDSCMGLEIIPRTDIPIIWADSNTSQTVAVVDGPEFETRVTVPSSASTGPAIIDVVGFTVEVYVGGGDPPDCPTPGNVVSSDCPPDPCLTIALHALPNECPDPCPTYLYEGDGVAHQEPALWCPPPCDDVPYAGTQSIDPAYECPYPCDAFPANAPIPPDCPPDPCYTIALDAMPDYCPDPCPIYLYEGAPGQVGPADDHPADVEPAIWCPPPPCEVQPAGQYLPECPCPLAAPSANSQGEISPWCPDPCPVYAAGVEGGEAPAIAPYCPDPCSDAAEGLGIWCPPPPCEVHPTGQYSPDCPPPPCDVYPAGEYPTECPCPLYGPDEDAEAEFAPWCPQPCPVYAYGANGADAPAIAPYCPDPCSDAAGAPADWCRQPCPAYLAGSPECPCPLDTPHADAGAEIAPWCIPTCLVFQGPADTVPYPCPDPCGVAWEADAARSNDTGDAAFWCPEPCDDGTAPPCSAPAPQPCVEPGGDAAYDSGRLCEPWDCDSVWVTFCTPSPCGPFGFGDHCVPRWLEAVSPSSRPSFAIGVSVRNIISTNLFG